MTSLNRIRLPRHITGARPSGAPEDLRTVRPRFLAPSPTDARATSLALGAHVVRLPRNFEARSTTIDGTPVIFARNGAEVHAFTDSADGVVEIVGFNAAQVDGIREWLDAAAVAPETELDAVLERVAARTPDRVDLDPKATDRDSKRAFQLLGLSATDDREVTRLVALADTLDDGGTSADAEVDRLVRLADGLSDG